MAVMKKAIRFLSGLLAFGGALLLPGCSSLPLPNAPNESLLVIAYQVDEAWRQGNIRVKSVDVQIENRVTGETRVVSLIPGGKYKSVALKPGEYIIKKLIVANQWQRDVHNVWFDTHNRYHPFYLNPQTVHFYDKFISLRARKEIDGYDLHDFRVRNDEKSDILTSLRKNSYWLAWRDHTLYGF